MIPGPPSRGTRISRRLILGGLFCRDSGVNEVARRSQEHGTRRRGTSLNHLIKHGDDGHRYTHSQDAETLTLTIIHDKHGAEQTI